MDIEKIDDNRTLKELSFLIALALLLTVPFIGKAFHIDDPFYFEIVKAIVENPAMPFSFSINWGQILMPGFTCYNPPLFCYFLAPFYYFFGASIVVLHLATIAFVIISVVGFYYTCNELNIKPLYPSLVLLSVPLFAVATNIMLDVPALAIIILFFYFFVRGINRDKSRDFILAGIFAAAAILTKYSALALMFPVLIYLILSRRLNVLWTLFIPSFVFAAWNIYTYVIYGDFHFMNSPSGSTKYYRLFLFHPLAFLIVTGMSLPYALTFIKKNFVTYIGIILGIITGSVYLIVNAKYTDIPNAVLEATGIVLGLYLIVSVIQALVKKYNFNRPFIAFLTAWILMVMVMNIFFTPFVALRNVVVMFPPVIVVLFKYMRIDAVRRKTLNVVLVVMFVLSFLLGYSDLRYAETYKDAAEKIAREYKGKNIWYLGHWGWQYYAEDAGFDQWTKLEMVVEKGDVAVIPRNVYKQKMTDSFRESLRPVETLRYKLDWLPLRSHGDMAHAGFYATELWRPLYTISYAPLEIFDIYKIK